MVLMAKILQRITRTKSANIIQCVNGLQTSSTNNAELRWRLSKGYTANPNKYGPLTNLPDYSFKDGRPTPLGTRHRARLNTQREYAEKIVKLTGEIDFAVERHTQFLKEEADRKQAILDSKLKPKGGVILKK